PQAGHRGPRRRAACGWDSGTGSAVCYGLPCQRTNDRGRCARPDGAARARQRPVPRRGPRGAGRAHPRRGARRGRGWFSPEQVARVVARAGEVRDGGRIVEIGSYRGRSMIAMARSAPPGTEIVAIDPHAGNDRGPQEIEGFEDEAAVDSKVFLANL